jgi:hypothetical protein
MRIILIQPDYRSTIWVVIESNTTCIRISTSATFDPYENLYIWLGQIRDYCLPASLIIDEEGYGVEVIAEAIDDEMIRLRIEPWFCRADSTTFLTEILRPDELVKAFHDGITEFIRNGYRSSDWSFLDTLSNICWKSLVNQQSEKRNWQRRILLKDPNNTVWEQLTNEQQWLIVLKDVLTLISVIAANKKIQNIVVLTNLYRCLPVDIILGEIDSEWYSERREMLNKEFGLDRGWRASKAGRDHCQAIARARISALSVGEVVDGTIVRISRWGLSVNIGGFLARLSPNEISQENYQDFYRVFNCGDWLRAVVVKLDIERLKVSISTNVLEMKAGDMLKHPLKVYETAELMAERYRLSLSRSTQK